MIEAAFPHAWSEDCLHKAHWAAATLTDDSNTRDIVARRILQYLLDHPAAADSVRGIRHWWLRDEGEMGEAVVTGVLDALTSRGWLLARGSVHETRIYSFNERSQAQARHFVEHCEEHLNG